MFIIFFYIVHNMYNCKIIVGQHQDRLADELVREVNTLAIDPSTKADTTLI